MTEERDYLKNEMRLSDKEVTSAIRFIQKHRKCKTICQSIGQAHYTISFSDTSIGSYVKITCEKCHKEKHISDDVRSNY